MNSPLQASRVVLVQVENKTYRRCLSWHDTRGADEWVPDALYVRRYVLCNSCKSPDTLLDRDSATRIMFLRCQQVLMCSPSPALSPAMTCFWQPPSALADTW